MPGHPDYAVSKGGEVFRTTRPKSGRYRDAALPFKMQPDRNGFVRLGATGQLVKPRMARKWVWGCADTSVMA